MIFHFYFLIFLAIIVRNFQRRGLEKILQGAFAEKMALKVKILLFLSKLPIISHFEAIFGSSEIMIVFYQTILV